MKRAIILILFMTLIIGSSQAISIDLNECTNEELIYIIRNAQNELLNRSTTNLLYNKDNIKIYLTGKITEGRTWRTFIQLEIGIENNSDKTISIYSSNIYINGWICGQLSTEKKLLPNTKAKDNIDLYLEETDITSWNDINEFSIIIEVYGDKNNIQPDNLITKTDLLTFPIIMNQESMTVTIGNQE